MRRMDVVGANPILDFEIDRSALNYVGHDLQRPECILAEPSGALWVADARGGVVRSRTASRASSRSVARSISTGPSAKRRVTSKAPAERARIRPKWRPPDLELRDRLPRADVA